MTNVFFLHHSTGRNLIADGKVRKLFKELGYEFWDHDYNSIGLIDPKGKRTGIGYNIPSDAEGHKGNGNTDPEGLSILFGQPLTDPPCNALSRVFQHDVLIFKSCFPNAAIRSREMLDRYKSWFCGIREVVKQHTGKVFVFMTLPPLHPLSTNSEEAQRTREWADWLKSPDFLDRVPNLFVFDLFGILADSSSHTLKRDFQRKIDARDSHPNTKANRIVCLRLVDFVDAAVRSYKTGKGP
jgi:hypothetical protein